MMRIGVVRLLALCVAVCSLPETSLAQATHRAGTEFQVNSYTPTNQRVPDIALDADGDFVVAWETGRDGSDYGVFARRFNSAGMALGGEFQVNTYTTGRQNQASVAIDGNGSFVVVWQSPHDGHTRGIFGRRFNAAGMAQGTDFQINSFTFSAQSYPVAARADNGAFVVVWMNVEPSGIFAQRFDSAGVMQGIEFQVNFSTGHQTMEPAVAMKSNGDFVAVWRSYTFGGILGRRFDSTGTAQGLDFAVSAGASNSVSPDIDLDGAGGFVVAWNGSYNQDGSMAGIFARRFSSAGIALASEFQVNSYPTGNQLNASVAVASEGDFTITWWGEGAGDSPHGVFLRRFDADGVPLAAQVQVNLQTAGSQRFADVAADAQGDFVVTWESDGQDGSDHGIFAQRFATLAVLDIDGNGATAPLSDGVLVLRFLFGFSGTTLVAGAVDGSACTRCDAPAIETYLQTLI